MGIVDRYPNGTFCWIDLGTTDPAAARAFYPDLFGWELVDSPSAEGGVYTICRLDGSDVTALHEHTPEEGSRWTTYISVDDVDSTTARAAELGARVAIEPFEIPGAARMAEIVDPVGAFVALWQPKGHIGARIVNEPGTWTWTELVVDDVDRAAAFYGALFGWTTQEIPAPSRRISIRMGELLIAGAHTPNPGERPEPRWDISFRVAKVDESIARARELGGAVVFGPMDIPIGRFAIIADPTGVAATITEFGAVVDSVATSG